MADGIVHRPGEGEVLRRARRVAIVKAGLPDLTVLEFTIEGPFEGASPPGGFEHELRAGSD